MRLGRERPRKDVDVVLLAHAVEGFNEAGARTPQKAIARLIAYIPVYRLQ